MTLRKRRLRRNVDFSVVAGCLAICLFATWFAWHNAEQAERQHQRESSEAAARNVKAGFEADLLRATESIRSLALMIANQKDMTRQQYLQFANETLRQEPVLSLLEWQPVVAHKDLAHFEAFARTQGMPGYRVTEPAAQDQKLVPARVRVEHVPVLYAAPAASAALGVDMAFDPERMESKYQSRDTRQAVASGSFPIISPDRSLGHTRGFAISQAVFSPADPRRLLGYAAGVIQIPMLFAEASARAASAHMSLYVVDHGDGKSLELFHAAVGQEYDPALEKPADIRLTVSVASRPWEIVLRPDADYLRLHRSIYPLMVLATGLVLTGILVVGAYVILRMRRKAEATRELTTEVKKTLSVERRRLHNILLATDAGTWEWNVQTGEMRVNERWAAMLGFSLAELAPVDFSTWKQLTHPDDFRDAQHHLDQHFRGLQDSYHLDLRMRHKQGSWITVQARGRLLSQTQEGKPEWVAGTHLDITEDKRVTRQLDNIRATISAHAIVSITDGRGTIQYVNDLFCSISGYSREELIGSDHNIVNSGQHPKAFFEEMWQTIATGQTWQGLICNRAKDGHLHWVESTISPILDADGAPEQYIAIRYDVTERRRIDEAIQANSRFLSQLADVIPGLVAYWNKDLHCGFANAAYREWFNKTEAELRNTTLLELIGQDLLEEYRPRIRAALAGEPQCFERVLTNHDGERHTFRVHYIPDIRDGEVPGFFVEYTDITDLRQSQHNLEEVNATLRRRTQEAESASRAKSAFLANMSHEIRTPMNGILGMLKLLQSSDLAPQQLQHARNAHSATMALLGIINDILDFSKVESGKMELECRRFSLDEPLQDLSIILSANLSDKPVELVFDISPDIPHILGDALRLQQILLNLAGNALKFTSYGEVVVRIHKRSHYAHGIQLDFAVEDTGVGIPAEKLESIFEGFTQAEASTTRKFGGTGLGLAISRSLVTLMGGALAVQSTPGRGSRFSFSLQFPLADTTEPMRIASHTPTPTPTPSHPRILIAEPHPLARAVLAKMVEANGGSAHVAATPEQLIAALGSRDPDASHVILIDRKLLTPQLCREVHALLSAHGDCNKSHVILLNHFPHEASRPLDPILGSLIACQLTKPLTASTLIEAIANAQHLDTAMPSSATEQPHPLHGLHLLVVEDNHLNQQVAQALLGRSGASVEIAGSGAEGIRRAVAARPAFDVILMDLQMPDMDGLETTRQLKEHPAMAAVPVIAMTANAMSSDKAACLAAGMVDHISKPIDVGVMVATILRHVRPPPEDSSAAPQIAVSASSAGTEMPESPQMPILDMGTALRRMDGNVELYNEIAKCSREEFEIYHREMIVSLQTGQFAQTQRAAHTLKGLAASVGAQAFSEAARQVEQHLKNHATPGPEFAALVATLEQQMSSAIAALDHALKRPPETT